jgi:hypothetical protein
MGDGCGKRVVKQHSDHAVEVRWPSSLLTDLDSPADFERVRRWRAHHWTNVGSPR